MNNKIFKKKSFSYLFAAFALLLTLVCAGSFFVFNASAAADVEEKKVRINIVKKGSTDAYSIDYSLTGYNCIPVNSDYIDFKHSDNNDATVYFYVKFDDDKLKNSSCKIQNAKYFDKNNNGLSSYDCKVDNGTEAIIDRRNATEYKVTLPKVSTSGDNYYAKFDLVFDVDKKLTFNSISSNNDWNGISEQFKIYDSIDDSKNEIKENYHTFLDESTKSFDFYVEIGDQFKDCLEKLTVSAISKGGAKEYTVTGETKEVTGEDGTTSKKAVITEKNNKKYRKYTLTFGEQGIKDDLILNLSFNGIYRSENSKIKIKMADDSKDVELNNSDYVEVKIEVPGSKSSQPTFSQSSNFKLKESYDANNEKYYEIVDESESNISIPYNGSVYLYVHPVKGKKYDGSAIKIEGSNVKQKEINVFADSDGNEYSFNPSNDTSFTGKDEVLYIYEVDKKFKSSGGKEYKYENNSFNDTDNNVTYTYDKNNKKFTDKEYAFDPSKNTSFTGKNGVVYTYEETNKKFKDPDGKEYEYKNNSFTGKNGVTYTYNENTKSFTDDGYAFDANTDTSFTGKNGVVYTYEETNKRFKDLDGNKYKYENNSFTGKNGEEYKMLFCYEISNITGEREVTVGGFEIKNLKLNVNFNGAPEGTSNRVTISVEKKTKTDTFETVEGVNGTYSGITSQGFVCRVYAGNENAKVNGQDIDIENIAVNFIGDVQPTGVDKTDDSGAYKEFSVADIKDDITMNISSVPYKTIGVSFHELDNNGNILDETIDNEESKKADIYLSGSTSGKISSFSSGQPWSFDLKFTDKYEASSEGLKACLYVPDSSQEGKYTEYIDKEISIKPSEDKRTFTFGVPQDIRGYKNIKIIIKNIVDRRLPVQFRVEGNSVAANENQNSYSLKDFKIEYIKQDKYKEENGMFVPNVGISSDGVYEYSADNWEELTNEFTAGGSGDFFLSNAVRIVPYNGILVFRITLKDESKAKYILDENLLVSANHRVEKKVVKSRSNNKEDTYSCIQVVVGSQDDGVKEEMTDKAGSVSIGNLESSIKEVTFKIFGKDEAELNPKDNHGGNILEKTSVYKINDDAFSALTEDKLYSSRILYQCTRNDAGEVENTKNSYMLNYKKSNNVIALRTMAGIDVSEVKCRINSTSFENPLVIDGSSNINTAKLDDGNNGYIVAFKIPDQYVDASSPDNLVIEISGIDIMKYKITLDGFLNQVKVQKKLSNESSFENVVDNPFEIDYGEDFEIKIIGTSKDSYEGLFNRISLGSGSALFIKEGTQSGGTALEKTDDGGFTYTFFVYKVKSNSTIIFKNEINKTMLDFDNVDGMEFYECSGSKDQGNLAVENKKIQGKISCAYGTKYSFAVAASAGYNLETFKLKATVEGSEPIEEGSAEFLNMFSVDTQTDSNYKIYTIINKDKSDAGNEMGVQKSTMFSGSISKQQKTVTFEMPAKSKEDNSAQPVLKYLNEQGEEISLISVEYGSNLTFSVSLSERYSNSGLTVGLYQGDTLIETLHTVSGHYKITNVTENYKVKVSGCSINSYFINFSKNDYVDYVFVQDGQDTEMNDNVAVSYGSSCYFKVKEKEGFRMGSETVVQATSASGEKLTLEKNSLGQYKLTNIKDNYTITVENVDEIFYSLKFIPIDGVTYYNEVGSVITGNFKVGYGKNFEFSIKIDDAHSESIQGAYIVTNESAQSEVKIQKLASDRYMIQGITQDITVRVANVNKNKYTVTLTKDEGIDYYSKDGKVITGENEVEYGSGLSFKVNLYPLYANSNIKVMLGNQELSADDNEYYTIESVTENKTVTVVGIGKTAVAEVIETINTLPTDINGDTDLEQIIQAVKDYNNLSDSEKSNVGNYYVLEQLQKKVADIIHTYNGVTAEGLDWNIKLIANPIDTDLDACTRIYSKLNSEYIISLYDIYLWDTLTERRYTLPEGKSVVIHLPTPNMSYFENPSGIHENSDGKINFLSLNIGNSVTSLETSSLSPIGIIADRSIQPGRSSLIDAVDSNVSMLTNYALGSLSGSGNKKESNYSGSKNDSSASFDEGEASTENAGAGVSKFRKTDNSTTRLGSALKLILIIMILLIIIAAIWALVKKYKEKSKKSQE